MFKVLLSCASHLFPSDYWKSFMKFRTKKSHEMLGYNLAWIALFSEWNHGTSSKPCKVSQRTLIELYNKSHKGFVLSWGQENASFGLKLWFKLYRDSTLTWFELLLTVFAWQCTLKQSCSTWLYQQLLFLGHELIQCLTWSFRAHNNQHCTVFGT